MAEQFAELVSELLDLPAQPAPRKERVENVDIAIRTGGAAGLRAEDLELGNPIPVADAGQASLVHLNT